MIAAVRKHLEEDTKRLFVVVVEAMGDQQAGARKSALPGRGRCGLGICDHGWIGAPPGMSAASHWWVRRNPTR
jgi:hypothetical protein